MPNTDEAPEFFVAASAAEILYDTFTMDQPRRHGPEMVARLGVPDPTAPRAIRTLALPNGPGVELFAQGSKAARRGAAVGSGVTARRLLRRRSTRL